MQCSGARIKFTDTASVSCKGVLLVGSVGMGFLDTHNGLGSKRMALSAEMA